jgi:hypothetical protein
MAKSKKSDALPRTRRPAAAGVPAARHNKLGGGDRSEGAQSGPLLTLALPRQRIFSVSGRDHCQPGSGVVLPRSPEKALELLDRWMADESDYEERTWPELKKALEQDRVSNRPLFPE